ncbi:MAG: DUF58 domain-containing protein [Bacteroidia bacterium]|nr:DUF58 domain-containing protein [Bacteroidia bacterium]
MHFYKDLFLNDRLFLILFAIVAGFVISFYVELLFPLFQTALVIVLLLLVFDLSLVFNKRVKIVTSRHTPKLLSLGDDNTISISVENNSPLTIRGFIVDESPEQFQLRDQKLPLLLNGNGSLTLEYTLSPKTRGQYHFGSTHCFISSFLRLVSRRVTSDNRSTVLCFPSIIQMKRYELKNLAKISRLHGVKKIRRIGHSYEFEQIKKYVHGDDYRSINWKATSRTAELMVNHYEDEKAQQVYCVIDCGRAMKMPFGNMTLLDHSVNSALVISNTIIKKHDKAGLLCFAENYGPVVKATRGKNQLRKIMDSLYNVNESEKESDFDMLYQKIRNLVNVRSLLLLYTNFESIQSMRRVLPILRKLNRSHLLVVVFFINVPVLEYSKAVSETIEQIYFRTSAKSFVYEKSLITKELNSYGIQTILCSPEDLSVSTINKYLELKSRGLI